MGDFAGGLVEVEERLKAGDLVEGFVGSGTQTNGVIAVQSDLEARGHRLASGCDERRGHGLASSLILANHKKRLRGFPRSP